MQQVIETLKRAKNAVIIPHGSIDGDAVCASLALSAFLDRYEIPHYICVEEEIPRRLQFLGGRFTAYTEELPAVHTAIAIDCGDERRLSNRLPLFMGAKVRINIDHHVTNTFFGDINYVLPTASAAAEIVTELFLQDGAPITKATANWMLAGMLSDTGGFRYSNTSAKTHTLAAMLMEKGADNTQLCRAIFEQKEMGKMLLEAEVIRSATITHEGRTAIGIVTEDMLFATGTTEQDADGISNLLRSIAGVETAVSLRSKGNMVKLSMRTEESVDAAALCGALGGGGHARAAGATLAGTPEEWKDKILTQIGDAYGRHS
ncbi:MAG: DHH family phosphoesterase [Clostridia bacterium]|nr:DHH family phosphoesterase [Clostridia bacterium]